MISAQEITLFIYNLTLLPVIFFSVLFIFFSFVNLFAEEKQRPVRVLKKKPFVSVQIPTFNDPIGCRCIKKCMEFDYDNYEIIIVDDSTCVKTQEMLRSLADGKFVKYTHRDHREGYKPGALRDAMSITKGELIIVFDADWIPEKDFIKKIILPFGDPDVAVVQARQGFYNHDTNLITRFATYTLMIYHSIVMPINNRINSVFFCGTAGAIRRSALESVGGWNINSITEDADLSVKLLLKGYKNVYVNFETPSEVPDTFESYIKQQMRWCYGNVRVFKDNWKNILGFSSLSFKQRLMISYITLGNAVAPAVVIMTVFGLTGWFLGEAVLFQPKDVVDFAARILYTSGFMFMGIVTLKKQNKLTEFKHLVASAFTVGLIIAVANSIAFFKAVFNRKLTWYCTPKIKNSQALK